MDDAELKRLWTIRINGMKAVNERVNAARRSAGVDELLLRADRMFIRGVKSDGKEEAKVREIWTKWRARQAAACTSPCNS